MSSSARIKKYSEILSKHREQTWTHHTNTFKIHALCESSEFHQDTESNINLQELRKDRHFFPCVYYYNATANYFLFIVYPHQRMTVFVYQSIPRHWKSETLRKYCSKKSQFLTYIISAMKNDFHLMKLLRNLTLFDTIGTLEDIACIEEELKTKMVNIKNNMAIDNTYSTLPWVCLYASCISA